jgi:hypothetical protein
LGAGLLQLLLSVLFEGGRFKKRSGLLDAIGQQRQGGSQQLAELLQPSLAAASGLKACLLPNRGELAV